MIPLDFTHIIQITLWPLRKSQKIQLVQLKAKVKHGVTLHIYSRGPLSWSNATQITGIVKP